MSFCYINVKTKMKIIFFFKSEKNLQAQLMSFCYINIETKMKKKTIFFSKLKICTSPTYVFLLHRRRNKRKKNRKYQNIYRSRKYLQVSVA